MWADEPVAEDPGVSFAELAILFVLETTSLPPQWCDGSWVLPALTHSVDFVLADIARVVGAMFKFIIQHGALAGTACIRVRTLALVGYKCNRGFTAGLDRRPAIRDARVRDVLRCIFHCGGEADYRRKAMSKGCRLDVGPFQLPVALV